jgi:hypothetical protein
LRLEERAAHQARGRARAEAHALERARARLAAEGAVEARVDEAQADTAQAEAHASERAQLEAELAGLRGRRGAQRPRAWLMIGVALAAAFAVGTRFGSRAPETAAAGAAPKVERELSLRLERDAQAFGVRAQALDAARR